MYLHSSWGRKEKSLIPQKERDHKTTQLILIILVVTANCPMLIDQVVPASLDYF